MTDELFKKYVEFGGGAVLGEPRGPERAARDDQGRYRLFQRGAIYWTPQTGAYVVRGPILDKWNSLGAELSALRYPTNDEKANGDIVYTSFQGGSIVYNQRMGRCEVYKGRQLPGRYGLIMATFVIWAICVVGILLIFHKDMEALVTMVVTAFTAFMFNVIRSELTGRSSDDD